MIAIAMFHQGKREQLHGEKGTKFLLGNNFPWGERGFEDELPHEKRIKLS
jgi:hypothetical protein